MSVVFEVKELIAPLGYYSYGIFYKSADDEESACCWYVSGWEVFGQLEKFP